MSTTDPAPEAPSRLRRPVDIRVYCLVDPLQTRGRPLVDVARAAVAGGATLVQYRDKHGSTRDMIANARALKQALEGTGVPLVINDRVDVALAAGADGTHVGQSDIAVRDARRLLGPQAIVGLSIGSIADAHAAAYGELDYVCIGAVFQTLSKADAEPPMGLGGLSRIATAIRGRDDGVPVGAIAGITQDNAAGVIGAGVGGVAVISAITAAPDPWMAARALRLAVDRALAPAGAA
ncbi:thiamine phosphate synthase [Pseudoxanthobacter sp.]|uniref:thiamine phosphate synthase n=1 Tax=Pseudoxanthobacter sp. TaxID=1925742 RepID=UPI002FE24875